jgi:hypothetical protein
MPLPAAGGYVRHEEQRERQQCLPIPGTDKLSNATGNDGLQHSRRIWAQLVLSLLLWVGKLRGQSSLRRFLKHVSDCARTVYELAMLNQ